MTRDTLGALLIELGEAFSPLKTAAAPTAARSLLKALGWQLPPGVDDLGLTNLDIHPLLQALEAVIQSDSEDESELMALYADLAMAIKTAIEGVVSVASGMSSMAGVTQTYLQKTGIVEEFVPRLIEYLIIRYVDRHYPLLSASLQLLGVFAFEQCEADPAEFRSAHLRHRIDFGTFTTLFSEPGTLPAVLYGWGTTSFRADTLLVRMAKVLQALGGETGLYKLRQEQEKLLLGHSVPEAATSPMPDLQVSLFQGVGWQDLDVGLSLFGLRPTVADGLDGGLGLTPYARGEAQLVIPLVGDWVLEIDSSFDVQGGVILTLRPNQDPEILAGLLTNDAGGVAGSGRLVTKLAYESDDGHFALLNLFGLALLEAQRFSLGFGAGLASGAGIEVVVEGGVEGGRFRLNPSGADSFIGKLLPKDALELNFDLTFGWSSLRGLYFEGSGSLEVTIPLHFGLGPITLESVWLCLNASSDADLGLLVGITLTGKLGPLSAAIDRVGVAINMAYVGDGSGNAGPFDVTPRFLPPTGAGFALDAGVLVGGGFLDFDYDTQRYSGALALKLGDIGITAIGLITTRMPDGSEGFSMLVNISITFNPAIQIYMGFTLAGVGGLVGVNRTMQTDVLREGLKKGTLDYILFPNPATVISNAAQIISDMRAVFPPEEGRFIIGPMIKIGWGTPTIVTGEIGVFIEIPDPVRIALMGQVEMGIPEPDNKIVGVHIDILGVLDLEKKELSFQASIYGSSLMVFELWGDCAFLLSWGSQPEFGLTIGGFHPKFTPPPPPSIFANLRRLGVNINYGPVIQLQCSGYLALTPNSFQFGARVGIFVGISALDVGISGFISFDALVIFSPFSFEVGVGGGMTVSVMGMTLAEIRVNFTLSGPTPWNVHGIGTVNVLFFEIDIGFNITWGRDDPAPLDPVNPWPLLEQALQRAESWGSRLPPTASIAVALRQIEDEPVVVANGQDPLPVPVIVHPAGTLEIRQNVAPLEVTLAKFGNAPIQNYDRFRIDKVTTEDGDELFSESVDEFFARGQFEQLSNSQKLSIPSFEKMQGGVTTHSSSQVAFIGETKSVEPRYDTILIKSDRTSKPAVNPDAAVSKWSQARFLASGNAARRCALRSQGHARFAHQGIGMVGTMEEKYVVVDAVHLKRVELDARVDVPAGYLTRTRADQVLAQQRAQGHARFAHRDIGMAGTKEEKHVVADAMYLDHVDRVDRVELDAWVDVPTGYLTRTQADQVLAQQLLLHPDQRGQLMVIAAYEVEEAS